MEWNSAQTLSSESRETRVHFLKKTARRVERRARAKKTRVSPTLRGVGECAHASVHTDYVVRFPVSDDVVEVIEFSGVCRLVVGIIQSVSWFDILNRFGLFDRRSCAAHAIVVDIYCMGRAARMGSYKRNNKITVGFTGHSHAHRRGLTRTQQQHT